MCNGSTGLPSSDHMTTNNSHLQGYDHGRLSFPSGENFSPLRQVSMRRSRLSGEMEREGGYGSPSMTPRNVTPSSPLRPLKWKSLTEEDNEQEKRPGLSGLGMMDANNALQYGVLSDAVVMMMGHEEDGEVAKLQHMQPSSGLGLVDQTKLVDELSLQGQSGTEQISGGDSPGGHERKPLSGEDGMTMTIEFLRARLLAERAASKAAKQQVQQLNKQMIELEHKLEETVEQREKAERAAEQALVELNATGSCEESAIKVSGMLAGDAFVAVVDGTQGRAAAPQAQESLVQPKPNVMLAEEEKKIEQDGTSYDKESIKVKLTQDTSVANDCTSNPHASVANGCMTADAVVLDKSPTPQNELETSNCLTQSQESRVAIEDRLRKMWSQISEEMNALAEERSEEDHVSAELMSWMSQVSAVLQEILPTSMGPHGQTAQGTNENRGLTIESAQENPKMDAEGKGATAFLEEFEAQESVQREWEKNYYDAQQNLEQNSQDLQHEEASARGGRMGTHPSHLESSIFLRQEDDDLMMRSSEDAHKRAQPELRVMTAAEKDALGEGLSRGQWQVQAETGIHHLQDGHDEANLLPAQNMLYGQKEGTVRGSRAQETSGQYDHNRSHSDGSFSWAGDGNFEIPRRSLDYGAGVESNAARDHTAYPRALTSQWPRFANADHGLHKELQQYQEMVDNEGAYVHRDAYQSLQGNNYIPEKLHQPQLKHLGDSESMVDKNSRFSNGEEPQLSLGYGPAYDAPLKEPSAVEQPPSSMDNTNQNVSDILQALQRLKLNIQGSSSEKIPNITSGRDPSLVLPRDAGYEASSPSVNHHHHHRHHHQQQQAPPPTAPPLVHKRLTHNGQRQQSTHPQFYYQHNKQLQGMYSRSPTAGVLQGAYSRTPPGVLQSFDSPSDSSKRMITYDSDYYYPDTRTFVDENNKMTDSSSSSFHRYTRNSQLEMIPVPDNTIGHSSYVDKLNVGRGIRFFFP